MRAMLIDPVAQTVSAVELEGDFLDACRREIGAPQLAVICNPVNRLAIWVDNMGLLKPGRAFWRFAEGDHRFAGRCILTLIDPAGHPMEMAEMASVEAVTKSIIWHGPETLESITERLVVTTDEEGRPYPMIGRDVRWTDAPPPEPAPDAPTGLGWSVYEREDGTFRAVEYQLSGTKLEPIAMFVAPSLEEVRAKLPPGLTRIEPAEHDNPDLVESWT